MQSTNSTFSSSEFIAKHNKQATPERLKILRALAKKRWFQASDSAIQDELATLPQHGNENHDGFLESLLRRKDEIGGVRVLRLLKLARGNYTVCPVFEVQNIETGAIYTYDFAAYRHGVPAGFKGIVLIRPDSNSKPSHIIILSGEKFATGEVTYDLLGGLPELDQGEHTDILKGIVREIREETGVNNLVIDEIKLLGTLSVDPGHTSHETNLFVAYINQKDAVEISRNAKNIDDFELNTYVHVLPLSELRDIVMKTSNAMLLAAIAKSITAGFMPLQYGADSLKQNT